MNRCLCITGATGFIGQHLIKRLVQEHGGGIRALSRGKDAGSEWGDSQVVAVRADLLDKESLKNFVEPDSVVVNLAFLSGHTMEEHLLAAHAFSEACEHAGAKRLVHVSTAMVVGHTDALLIDERTPCRPITAYERVKLAIEEALLARERRSYEVVILRPTAVFGPGGRNLVKLAREVATGNAASRYLRASFQGRRSMHLVDVNVVIEAIRFLATTAAAIDGESYIVADDDPPTNNYRDVEANLLRAFGKGARAISPVPVPAGLRQGVLSFLRRSGLPAHSRFKSQKLQTLGFRPPIDFDTALSSYAGYLATQFQRERAIRG